MEGYKWSLSLLIITNGLWAILTMKVTGLIAKIWRLRRRGGGNENIEEGDRAQEGGEAGGNGVDEESEEEEDSDDEEGEGGEHDSGLLERRLERIQIGMAEVRNMLFGRRRTEEAEIEMAVLVSF